MSRSFVSALQRCGHAPKLTHVKSLSHLTRLIQVSPKNLTYKVSAPREDWQVGTGSHQRVCSDSAFKKEEQTGHCMRGEAYLLCPGPTDEAFVYTSTRRLLDFVARQQRRFVRATLSAEFLGRLRFGGQRNFVVPIAAR